MELRVGSIVKLGRECLDCSINTIGVCYEVYNIGNREGFSIIFSNGNYDGFSNEDLKIFEVKKIGYVSKLSKYKFISVLKLADDFQDGHFNDGFNYLKKYYLNKYKFIKNKKV